MKSFVATYFSVVLVIILGICGVQFLINIASKDLTDKNNKIASATEVRTDNQFVSIIDKKSGDPVIAEGQVLTAEGQNSIVDGVSLKSGRALKIVVTKEEYQSHTTVTSTGKVVIPLTTYDWDSVGKSDKSVDYVNFLGRNLPYSLFNIKEEKINASELNFKNDSKFHNMKSDGEYLYESDKVRYKFAAVKEGVSGTIVLSSTNSGIKVVSEFEKGVSISDYKKHHTNGPRLF